jgi:hypothetical protein
MLRVDGDERREPVRGVTKAMVKSMTAAALVRHNASMRVMMPLMRACARAR